MVSGRLYDLLPAVYRVRDARQGYPLRGLMAVLERTLDALEADVGRLYDDAFIETCQEWVVPYLGDLLGVPILHRGTPDTFSLRTWVANTLGYRRRKGTAAILAHIARDLTGWPGHQRESFPLVGWTQNVNHVRPRSLRTPDLRDVDLLARLGGPFEEACFTVDVRPDEANQARYNVPNVGVFLWRLESYPLRGVSACPLPAAEGAWRFTFDPLGLSGPLFNRPRPPAGIASPVREPELPAPLRRLPLYEELIVRRERLSPPVRLPNQPLPDGFDVAAAPRRPVYFGAPPVLALRTGGREIPPERILIASLGAWPRLSAEYADYVAVDPELGRIAFPEGVVPTAVEVDFSYGFGGDLGAGPYDRSPEDGDWLGVQQRPVTWRAGVRQGGGDGFFASIGEALAAWDRHVSEHPTACGLIAVTDSATYGEDLTVTAPDGSRLALAAARRTGADEGGLDRFYPQGVRPLLAGGVEVAGREVAGLPPGGEVILDGLLIDGALTIRPERLARVDVLSSTLVPDRGGITASAEAGEARLTLRRTITGPISVASGVAQLALETCVVDGGGGAALAAGATAAGLRQSTLLGPCESWCLEAEDTLFTGPVRVVRQQLGALSYCYLPLAGSRTPRRYRCEPDLALDGVTDPAARADIQLRLRPQFRTLVFGAPEYGQLAPGTDRRLLTGAGSGAEIGVFGLLRQAQRRENLRAGLDEYLRLSLVAGLSDAT